MNVNVGVDVTVEQLREEFDAIVLAGGATAWRDLPIPGREHGGIHQAMEFLPWGNRVQQGDLDAPPITAEGKRVVIIGGGDTGADCLGTSHRQGAVSVHQFEIMPRPPDTRAPTNPWPTWSNVFRVSSAHEEGGERVYSVNTECFLADDDGNVRALRAHEVEMVDGKFEKIEGTDFELPCELVLLAMGFLGPQREGLLEQLARGSRRARQRGARRRVHDQRARGVRVRRHGPRAEPHRVGDRRGPLVCGRRRHLADGGDAPPQADRPDHAAAAVAAAHPVRPERDNDVALGSVTCPHEGAHSRFAVR